MARNGLLCADVPLRNYSINQSMSPLWLYIMDDGNFGVTLSRASKITASVKVFTLICLFTMPLLCVYDDD